MTSVPALDGLADRSAELGNELARVSSIVCFANDWRGDPTSKHHIMRTYADHVPVVWVESAGMRRPQLARRGDLGRIVQRLQKSLGGLSRESERLSVLSPLSAPLPGSAAAARLNGVLYRRSVQGALKALGLARPPLLWVYTPTVAPYITQLPRAGLVYHCVDRWWAFADYDGPVMLRRHAELCRAADVVFASSAELLEDCLRFTPRAHLVRHGVEWAHFASAAFDPPPVPHDLTDVEGPVFGFFGLIHEWVDQDLVCRLADAFPDATVALIGKVQVDVSRLRRKANIRLLGQKAYRELPAYAAAFDVALIPFAINDLTRAVNPIKLREYLSAGLPVVATALPEIQRFAAHPRVATAADPEGFVEGARRLLASGSGRTDRRETAAGMAGESWPGRCAEMARLVRAHVSRAGPVSSSFPSAHASR